MKNICVYMGSNYGARPEYRATAQATARAIAQRGMSLVYGGSERGLMKETADTMLSLGGKITGVITQYLFDKGVAHPGVKDMRVVSTMHERKALMYELADAFIALPGSYGTMDEMFEMLAWAHLHLHSKPCGLINVCGYYDDLLKFLDLNVQEKFLPKDHLDILLVADSPEKLLDQFSRYQPPKTAKWL